MGGSRRWGFFDWSGHLSFVIGHLSLVICHLSFVIGQDWGTLTLWNQTRGWRLKAEGRGTDEDWGTLTFVVKKSGSAP
jgi:hypothetical protein